MILKNFYIQFTLGGGLTKDSQKEDQIYSENSSENQDQFIESIPKSQIGLNRSNNPQHSLSLTQYIATQNVNLLKDDQTEKKSDMGMKNITNNVRVQMKRTTTNNNQTQITDINTQNNQHFRIHNRFYQNPIRRIY